MATQIELLKKYQIPVRGHLGQHLLMDANIQHKIIDLLDLKTSDHVLEIGPGLGALTGHLLGRCRKFVAVEKDLRFAAVLKEEYPAICKPPHQLIEADFLKYPLQKIVGTRGRDWKAISNLPYYITTPILFQLLACKERFSKMVFMMQKEMAYRLFAGPGAKDYGRMTLAVRYAASVEHAFDVSPGCFTPQPEVASTVLVLTPHPSDQKLPPKKEKLFFHLIQTAFSQRRKMLLNLLASDRTLDFQKVQIETVFKKLNIPRSCRGEELMLKDYFGLTQEFSKKAFSIHSMPDPVK